MEHLRYDIVIVGAGPAGASCAIQLAKTGLQVAVMDKASFPRDKICGDALSVDVVNQLHKISPKLASDFEQLSHKVPSYGVRIYAPSGEPLDIPFIHKQENKCGYLCQREVFDHLLVTHMLASENVSFFQNQTVTSVEVSPEKVVVVSEDYSITASVVIGADGAQSVVSRFLSGNSIDRRYYSAGLRVYYENVSSFTEGNHIELLFFKDTLPGYFWIFPLPDNRANVGIGILSSAVAKKKINLRKSLEELIVTHPVLKDRFRNAKPLEASKGFGLPLGGKKRKISGDRFLLLGDAAGLIDPFSGEGIGNAIRSGRVAAAHLINAFEHSDFSSEFNKNYDAEIYRLMQKEFRISRSLQKICKRAWLFNRIVRKANRNEYLKQFLTGTLSDIEQKKLLTRPGFYFNVLFK